MHPLRASQRGAQLNLEGDGKAALLAGTKIMALFDEESGVEGWHEAELVALVRIISAALGSYPPRWSHFVDYKSHSQEISEWAGSSGSLGCLFHLFASLEFHEAPPRLEDFQQQEVHHLCSSRGQTFKVSDWQKSPLFNNVNEVLPLGYMATEGPPLNSLNVDVKLVGWNLLRFFLTRECGPSKGLPQTRL